MSDEESKSQLLWGIPVIESDQSAPDELWLVTGRGVIRQDARLEWDGDCLVLRAIGEPYDA